MLTNNSNASDIVLENHLKEILSDMLQILESSISSDEELSYIQQNLQDYENMHQLAETMKFIFKILKKKFQANNYSQKFFKCEPKQQNYEKLEHAVQKYEQEIRVHIRTQHEMKIFIENLQQSLEESELIRQDYLRESTLIIQKLKKENYQLVQQLKYYNTQYKPTPLTSRRVSIQTVNQTLQKQPSKSSHNPDGMQPQELNTIRLQQTQNNSMNELFKQKDSQKSLTQRKPLQSSRNKSYSVGLSKQQLINNSFIQKIIQEQARKNGESYRQKQNEQKQQQND